MWCLGRVGTQRVRAWVVSGLFFLVIGCGEDGSPTGTGNTKALKALWTIKGWGWSTPEVDGTSVYFLGSLHDVLAVDKNTGVIRWQATTGVTTDVFTNGSGGALTSELFVVGDSNLVAFQKTDGAKRWTFVPAVGRLSGLFRPLAVGDVVVAGSASGHVYAIDATTGTAKWTTMILPGSTVPSISVYDPVVDNGIIFASYTNFKSAQGGVDVGGVVALNLSTGQILWSTEFPVVSPLIPSSALSVAVHQNVVVSTARDGRIYAFDAQTGAALWTGPKIAPPASYPYPLQDMDLRFVAACGTRVYVTSTTGYVMAYELLTGKELWQQTADRGTASTAVCDDEYVYVVHAGGQLALFDAATGAVRYRYDPPIGVGFNFAVTPEGKKIYAGGSVGYLALVRP